MTSPTAPDVGQRMLAESKFFMGYARWDDAASAYETWPKAVARVMRMHAEKYAQRLTPELTDLMAQARQAYENQLILGAQRALQFGGEQIRKHEAKMYNCSFSYADRPRFFQETMYLLLCGCGVGFSVQQRHVGRLPAIAARAAQEARIFQIPDCIEGWADAFGVLLSSYFVEGSTFPQYQGAPVHFDYSRIRPAGALISGGFKAPGPDGLRRALEHCEALLERTLAQGMRYLSPIVVYDFVMHMADAVLSGGVRRSATICLFDKDDEDMLAAKTGNWFVANPQRGRSNNSVIIQRDQLTRDEWARIMHSVRDYGEPGFVFTDNLDFGFNPCVEIGLYPISEAGETGFQFCNLSEINGAACDTRETFLQACQAAAILGTLQAGYTEFTYLGPASRQITEREALIGVSITGWMNNPKVLFNEALLQEGAELVRATNRRVAQLLGIRAAARTTCVKPSGNASVLLGTASGIHGEHAPRYLRHVQMNAQDEVARLLQAENPDMCQASVWNPQDIVVAFPLIPKAGSIYKEQLLGVRQLEYVKKVQRSWIAHGTDPALCRDPRLRHNVSNTVTVDDWDEVEQYIFDNRAWFAGISLLAAHGDRAYPQAPFTQIFTAEQIIARYGQGAMFASGLIVDGLHAFNDNFWLACDTALGQGLTLSDGASDLLKRDWVRRFAKFARNYFGGDGLQTSFCLKDCYNLHKWQGILNTLRPIDFAQRLGEPRYTAADSLASQACVGGACEVAF
ncbi:hypothetical protein [Castellaniella caeni]|uniref:hypothetical protein n=1 Tax=Castellaniella caeni TaxID=266123 RepID=UPI0008324F19|nr:hypothetical protein [Castellaniella caeni]